MKKAKTLYSRIKLKIYKKMILNRNQVFFQNSFTKKFHILLIFGDLDL